jgi:hypothetical protein
MNIKQGNPGNIAPVGTNNDFVVCLFVLGDILSKYEKKLFEFKTVCVNYQKKNIHSTGFSVTCTT